MRVALVHDWLIHMRGGEKVLEALAEVFPNATIYTLLSRRERLSPSLQRMEIKNSLLQYLPGIHHYYRWLLPFLPLVIRSLRIEDTDVVISVSHCVAKGVRIPPGATHICYCLTPMRYLWGFEEEYFGNFPRWFRACLEPIFQWLRRWDRDANLTINHFYCISKYVRKRIERVYSCEAKVIYPPVDTSTFELPDSPRDDYYLVVSALTPYKRADVPIQAFNGWGRKLLIAGEGPLRKKYENLVETDNIRFLGKVSGGELKALYQKARALIFVPEEDFGIVPLEAQACGTPVIAYARGGVLETVKEGVFFNEQTPDALRQAVLKFESLRFDSQKLRQQSLPFDKKEFKHKIKQTIEKCLPHKNEPSRSV